MTVLFANLPYLLQGAGMTIVFSVAGALLAAAIGLGLALLHVFGSRPVRALVQSYLYLVRGVPLLVLLFAMYYMLPYAGIDLPPILGGILVIAIYFAAFMAEVFRAAIVSVPKGQWDAARALGMGRRLMMSIIIVPQAARLAGPPLINTCIMLIKNTSLISIIGLWELTLAGRELVERTLAAFQIFGGVAVIYFVICYCLSLYGQRLERRLHYAH